MEKRRTLAAGRWVCVALVATLLATLAPGTLSVQAQAGDDSVVSGQYIVVVNAGYNPNQVAASHSAAPLHVYTVASRGFAARLSPAQVDKLRADPRVNSVVPDRYVSAFDTPDAVADGKRGGGGGTTGQVIPAGVARIGADQLWAGGITGSGVGVAVVDTGIDFNQTDLTPVSTECYTSFASCQDDNGHGTHVSGIIAARNNSQDVVGVAPDATLYAVKVLDRRGSGTWSSVVAGIDWVTARADQIKVANLSLGGSGPDTGNCGKAADGTIVDPLHDAICNSVDAGVTYVVAAGNDASKDISQMVPAAYPEVIAVASTTAVDGTNSCGALSEPILADTASYFTTDGSGVAVSAPGEEAENVNRACFIKSAGILSLKLGGGTTRMSGTSMASPHVAGVVALMLGKDPSLTPTKVRSKIQQTADRKGVAPLDSPTSSYTYDGTREGIAWAVGATQ